MMVNVSVVVVPPASSQPITVPFVTSASNVALKLMKSVMVVALTKDPVRPLLESVLPISAGFKNVYNCVPSNLHLTAEAELLMVQVNNTVSPGQGFSWARPCLLVSDGITVDDNASACT